MMTTNQIAAQLSQAVFDNGSIPEGWKLVKTLANLRGIKSNAGHPNPALKDVKLIEQNPRTGSRFAKMAMCGHKILWAFKENGYWSDFEGTRGIINEIWQKDMHSCEF